MIFTEIKFQLFIAFSAGIGAASAFTGVGGSAGIARGLVSPSPAFSLGNLGQRALPSRHPHVSSVVLGLNLDRFHNFADIGQGKVRRHQQLPAPLSFPSLFPHLPCRFLCSAHSFHLTRCTSLTAPTQPSLPPSATSFSPSILFSLAARPFTNIQGSKGLVRLLISSRPYIDALSPPPSF